MIKLKDITTQEFHSVSIEIEKGSLCKVITNSDYERKALLDTILGIKKPISGTVSLFGKDIFSSTQKELGTIFGRIGVVWEDGGLISNLKVWENLILPKWYHTGKITGEMEKKAFDIFKEIGINSIPLAEYMGKLPGTLPEHERRLIGLVRAILTEPEIIIYDSIFEGLSPEIIEKLVILTTRFHTEKPGRTSVYISSQEESLKHIKADTVLKQKDKGLYIWR